MLYRQAAGETPTLPEASAQFFTSETHSSLLLILDLLYNANLAVFYVNTGFLAVASDTLQGVYGVRIGIGGVVCLNVVDASGNLIEIFNIVGQVVTYVGRLVVCSVLPCHAHAVGVVVHKGRHSVFRGDVGGKDVECASVR